MFSFLYLVFWSSACGNDSSGLFWTFRSSAWLVLRGAGGEEGFSGEARLETEMVMDPGGVDSLVVSPCMWLPRELLCLTSV